MTLRFGTDGVRGVANVDLTPELVVALGRAAARVIGCDDPFFVARDTRRSGPVLEAALVAGLCAEGATVQTVGVLPTPGLAFIGEAERAPAAMISASHNPFGDNGIKLFAPGGRKVSDATEAAIEAELSTLLDPSATPRPSVAGAAVGTVTASRDAAARYRAHLVDALDGRRLDGMTVVLDCANGAAHEVAPSVLRTLGAAVTVLNAEPDGTNINAACGSTHPQALGEVVRRHGADAGLALDGDADRVIAVDEQGTVVDGDRIIAVCALDLLERGRLRGDAVAVTVMSNLGLRQVLHRRGVEVVETPVGDRHVLDAMERDGLALGGEQSGHVVFADLATTGDGTLTGLVLLDVMGRSATPLSHLAAVMTAVPQVLHNVRVADRDGLDAADAFWTDVRAAEAALGTEGRVLVRPSGTEPVVRIMVEAPTEEGADATARRLADGLVAALGAG